jgi:uncharacterized protein YmfQ (DUF2313 family)
MPAESLVEQYRDQMRKLFPPGSAMSRRLDSCLTEWSIAFAVEFARIHEALDTLYQESFPDDATDTAGTGMLADWETLCGLPNACTRYLTSEADRQTAVMAKFAVDEGQSRADFQSLASPYGYALDVSTYTTSRCGVMRCGHTPLHSDPWLFASRMSYEFDGAAVDGYKILEATLGGSTDITADTSTVLSVSFAGEKMYVCSYTDAYQYILPTAFDPTGAVWDFTATDLTSDTGDSLHMCIRVNADGTRMYTLGATNDRLYQWTLSTPYDIPSESFDGFITLGTQDAAPAAFDISQDGTKIYVFGQTNAKVFRYSMTAWDISTASFDTGQELSTSASDVDGRGIAISDDGTKLFVAGATAPASVYQYDMSTPYSLTSASLASGAFNMTGFTTSPQDLSFSPSGQQMYTVEDAGDVVQRWDTPLAERDAGLECNLAAHRHIHTHINFNPWDPAPVQQLTGLTHHFVHGEYVTTPGTDNDGRPVDEIDEWTNRESGNDWTSTSFHSKLMDGWEAAGKLDATSGNMSGLYIRSTPTADTLLEHSNFSLFIAGYVDHYNGVTRGVLVGTDFYIRQVTSVGETKFHCDYDGSVPLIEAPGEGPFVLHVGINGTAGYIHSRLLADGVPTAYNNSFAVAGTASTDALLNLSAGGLSQLGGGFFEVIAAEFSGIPNTGSRVDDVLDYLEAKYIG